MEWINFIFYFRFSDLLFRKKSRLHGLSSHLNIVISCKNKTKKKLEKTSDLMLVHLIYQYGNKSQNDKI